MIGGEEEVKKVTKEECKAGSNLDIPQPEKGKKPKKA